MGAGAQWRAASRSTVSAHTAHRRRKCCDPFYRRNSSRAAVAAAGFLFFLGVFLLCLPAPFDSEETRTVTLLLWTHPFGRHQKLPDCLALYQIGGCTLTDDRSAYLEADAVIIHHREIASGTVHLPPEPRPAAQKWIWMNYESPTHTPGLWRFEGVFNLTFTYRTDSDIFLSYGYLVPNKHTTLRNHFAQPLHAPSRTSWLLRPRLLAWVVSNWSESHARVAFYYQLRQYIKVDVFGRAGRPLPEDTGSDSVVRMLGRYQFYLALENSQHTDYITEKLWNAVLAGSIPVVLGPSRQNYERFLPPEAFIHVDDFSTVRALAQYLLRLKRDPARLGWHLNWRGSYSMHKPSFWAEHFCTACRSVRGTRGRTEVVRDLTGWFHS